MVKVSKTHHVTKDGVVKKNPTSSRKPLPIYEEKRPALVAALGEQTVVDLENQIDKIESSIPTTKNHYGDYMAVLSKFPSEQRLTIGNLLYLMGANKQGVHDAFIVLRGR